MSIIGYIHICQTAGWIRSFNMLITEVRSSGLYDATAIINCGIVSDTESIQDDEILHDPKFNLMHLGNTALYERPTLLHMRNNAIAENKYWYLHTKGLRHFGTPTENNVIDWINLMLYWNIRKWNNAVEILNTNNTYGCNKLGNLHYSGNFWWATGSHILNLPTTIQLYYIASEDYILSSNYKTGFYNAFSSGLEGMGHYSHPYPASRYTQQKGLKLPKLTRSSILILIPRPIPMQNKSTPILNRAKLYMIGKTSPRQ